MCNNLPSGFIDQMSGLLGENCDAFIDAMNSSPSVSIKINRRKLHDPKDLDYENMEPVKWCESGFYLPERPLFTANPLLHCGAFYVQDASSMIYEEVIHRILPSAFDTGHPLRVLDLCAAPGGKSTSMINALPDHTLVVANEFIPNRASILKENLIKWGYPDIVLCNSKTSDFAKLGECFDIVAVDAPCSGEGMMRKDADAVKQWGPKLQSQCSELQKAIINDAFATLKPGGFLIYSTCTFNRVENEEMVDFMVENLSLVPVDLDFPVEWNIAAGIETPYPCYRFMPHLTKGEGLFLCVLRKEGDYPVAPHLKEEQLMKLLEKNVRLISKGIPKTNMKGKLELPASESVLSTDYKACTFPEAEVDLPTAIAYLSCEAIYLSPDTPKGFVVIKYKGYPLGLVKNIGSRANNLYPSHWKIRMSLGK